MRLSVRKSKNKRKASGSGTDSVDLSAIGRTKDFAAGKGMTARTKVRIMVTVTLLMTVALVAMGVKGVVAGCVVLGFVWAFHMVYFIWFVKTIPA